VRRLLYASIALAVLLVGHVVDHAVRQPADQQLSLAGSAPGLLGAVAVLGALVVVARGGRRAPEVAGLAGLATAAGFVAVHLAPHWSMFSDPYPDRALDAGSWTEMLATLACGLLVAYEAQRLRRPAVRAPG
jgi:hypothetical protein